MLSSFPCTADDIAFGKAAMRALGPLGDAELEAALAHCAVAELERGAYLLRAGDDAVYAALVVRGLLREFFIMSDGVERTKAFVRSGESSGSLADLLARVPSRATIVAEEPSRLLLLPFTAYRGLVERFAGWRDVYLRGLEQMYQVKAMREYELLGLNAEERYQRFAERYRGLEARVAARHVASYLGITPVHLSRLRRLRRQRRGP